MKKKLLRGLGWTILVVFTTAAMPSGLATRAARGEDSGRRTDTPADERNPSQNTETKPGCIPLFGKEVCGIPEATIAANLIANGPSVSLGGDESYHNIQGFVRDGWPIVADFQPLPGSRTWLVVTLYEPKPFATGRSVRLEMDHDGSTGRRYYKMPELRFPDAGRAPDGSGAVRVATFQIQSQMLGADGKPRGPYVDVQLFGLGAGPRAVGSVSLTGVKIGPGGAINRSPIPYQYLLEQPFDLVAADMWRYCTKFLCPHTAFSQRRQLVIGPYSNSFMPKKSGPYRLYVRAWLHCANADVTACGDSAAWAAGESNKLAIPG